MPLPLYTVDAFTMGNNLAFTGNPAAVCILSFDDDIDDDEKQRVANEMNLSETAFISMGWTKTKKMERKTKEIRRTLRWFTPTTEVSLCGHATLAAAKVLATIHQHEMEENTTIIFETKFVGELHAVVDTSNDQIMINLPSNPTSPLQLEEYDWLKEMISKTLGPEFDPVEDVGDVQYSPTTKILLIRLSHQYNETDLMRVKPDFLSMMLIDTKGFLRDIVVTCKGHEDYKKPQFFSRFFAPWDGINEDPVTGLAHTVLTPYWSSIFPHTNQMWGRQLSKRKGDVKCSVTNGNRVTLTGSARIIIRGEIYNKLYVPKNI